MEQLETIRNFLTPDYLVFIRAVLWTVLLVLAIYYLVNIGNMYIERSRRINVDLKIIARIIALILVFFVLRYVFISYPILGNTLSALIISVVLAYVINPVVNYLQTKSIPRKFGVLIVYIGFILVLSLLFVVVIPRTTEELRNFVVSLPSMAEEISSWFQKYSAELAKNSNLDIQGFTKGIEDQFNNYIESFQVELADRIKSLASGMYTMFGKIISFILILIFTYYFSVDKERIKVNIYKNIPRRYKSDILFLSDKINQALLAFLKGKLLLAFFVGLATMVMLVLLGVDFAIVIGIITMIADIIPYIGPFLGFLPAFFFALIDSKIKAFWVGVLFIFLQWAENNILAPKILGSRTGLAPIVVLLCIVVGGGTFGVVGMIFSVPIFSIILILKDFVLLKIEEEKTRKEEIRKMQ